MFLGVLAVHFFVFTENIIHSFLGMRNDVWASVHMSSLNETLVRLAFMSHQPSS